MPRPSNILWILTTQWRAQACGYAGDVNARTPFLDGLASCSVNYTQAVTPHPFGPFARAALLTGIPSPANGVQAYFDPLPPHTRTVAHALNDRGYHTGFFGKWHLSPRDPHAPLVGDVHARSLVPQEYRGGFTYWEGFESGFLLNDPWIHGSLDPYPRQHFGYQSEILVDRFLSWHDSTTLAGRQPWFAVVSMEAPHPPYLAPANGIPSFRSEQLILPPNVPRGTDAEVKARRELSGYYAHIQATDRAIGRLLSQLPSSTIVVFTSVHGDMHGAHGLFRKGWPYEESIRVPLLVRGAPVKAASTTTSSSLSSLTATHHLPISLLSLPSMTLSWAEGSPWTPTQGTVDISMPSVVALPQQCDRCWHGRRSPTHKWIYQADGTLWLEFNLLEDPFEQRNLA